MNLSIKDIFDMGVYGLLAFALISGAAGVWVYGWAHREAMVQMQKRIDQIIEDRDSWKRMALRGTDVTEKAVDAVSKRV